MKQIVYLAEYSNQTVTYQKDELIGAERMSFEDAIASLQFDGIKKILTKANKFITD